MKVSLIMAQTLDGIISRSSSEFVDWTGSSDKKLFKQMTKEAGVVIMGSKTFDTIGKPLPDRKNVVLTRNKKRISDTQNLLYTSEEPQQLLNDLQDEGYSNAALIGGAEINSLFAKYNLIDDLYITIAPRIFGLGLTLFTISLDLQLRLVSSEVFDSNYLLLHYAVE